MPDTTTDGLRESAGECGQKALNEAGVVLVREGIKLAFELLRRRYGLDKPKKKDDG